MTPTQYVLLGIAIWLFLAIFTWAIVHGGSLGEDDPEEFEPRGYVDQDGESTPGRDAWKHAAVKTHHAE